MPLLLECATPSSKVLIDNLEFYTKNRSHLGLLSSTYLIAQRFSLLDLQVHYLRCPYDIQEKISSHVQEKWFDEWYATCIDCYHQYSYYIWESRSTTIYFSDKSGVDGVCFLPNSISPNGPIIKAWEYAIVLYFMEIPDPKYPFFPKLTKFQQCMFGRIHWILTSPDGAIKIRNNWCLYVEVCCALIDYENGKVKPTHYLV